MENVVIASEADFEQKVVEESKKRPVVVDFWAPWCGPCRALTPVLEAEAKEADGGFLLVKLNTDENPNLSQQFGIRGIPAVKAFVDGRVVDEFTGALPKTAVHEFLTRLVPGPEDELAKEALQLVHDGHMAEADAKATTALETVPNHPVAHIVRAQVAAARGDVEAASHHINKADGDATVQPAVDALRAQLTFVAHVQRVPDAGAAREAADSGDLEAGLSAAAHDVIAGKPDEAFERLLKLVAKSEVKAAAHKLALALIATTGDPDRAREMRKKLSMALY
jgi:putative thioredoxin